MKIVYYTSGVTGSGRVVRGIAIANALRRRNIQCTFTILHNSRFGFLADGFTDQVEIPIENERTHSVDGYQSSALFRELTRLDPDILIVDLVWFTLHNFIGGLRCKKLFLLTQIADERFFSIKLTDGALHFEPDRFDLMVQAEPLPVDIGARRIHPILLRNRDEILPVETALDRLKLGRGDGIQNCLFAYNGEPGELEVIKKKYAYLKDAGYRMLYSTNYAGPGYFPIVDYFNAFDFIISGAGYNSFWEIIYFNKEAAFEPVPRTFEDQSWRVRECQEYYFDVNGADQLVDLILTM